MTQQEKAIVFRQAHQTTPLVLPNVWDAASAKIVEQSGAVAIATTSAGVSWSRGVQDGESLGRDEMTRSIAEIAAATSLPVTADIESGYGLRRPADVGETTRAVLAAGAVGINLEDTPGYEGSAILGLTEQAERIEQAREAARSKEVDLFINARIDIYLARIGNPAERMEAVIQRAAAYIQAGADGIFVPGLIDLETIRQLVEAIDAPLNIMGGRGAPDVPTLKDAGVARVSLGPVLTLACFSAVRKMTQEVLQNGTFSSFPGDLTFSEMDGFFGEDE